MRFALALIWLLGLLPLRLLAPLGQGLGMLVYWLVRERRRVVRTNLRLCFPQMTDQERKNFPAATFALSDARSLEHSILWWGSEQRIRSLVAFEGRENLDRESAKPLLVLAPHFVGLDMAGSRISVEYNMMAMFSHQKNPVLDRILLHGRTRFGESILVSRQDGLRAGGPRAAQGCGLFLPAGHGSRARGFGVRAFLRRADGNRDGLSRLARITGARVVPCITRQLPAPAAT